MRKIISFSCGYGSFGIYKGKPGGVQTVWFCGQYGKWRGVNSACVHETRKAARECRRQQILKNNDIQNDPAEFVMYGV